MLITYDIRTKLSVILHANPVSEDINTNNACIFVVSTILYHHMKVLNVIDGTGWCGTKEQAYLITLHLKKRGIESEMALAENHLEMINRLKGETNLYFYGVHKSGLSRINPYNLAKLKSIINRGNYDFVIAHSSHTLDFIWLVYPFLKNKPKIIALRRSGFMPGVLSRKIKYRIASKIVAVSRKVGEALKKKAFPPEKVEIIESGIDLSRFKPMPELRTPIRNRLGVSEDEILFINVANWQPWRKGQEVILKALSLIKDMQFKILFVGRGTDSEEALESFKRYGLENKCIGLGFRDDVHELLQAADIFLFGSFSEGIAGAVLQAMATGRIVISTNAGGIPEYLIDGHNGFMVNVGDYEAMANKIISAVKMSEDVRNKISMNAMQTARKYSIECTVDKYVNLLNSLRSI